MINLMQKHPIISSIIVIFIYFGIPVSLFPDADDIVIYFIVFLEILITITIVYLISSTNQPTNSELELQQEQYENLLKQYNVPENHFKAVIHDCIKYDLFYTPVIMWRDNNSIKMLTVNQIPHIIETPLKSFSRVYMSTLSKYDESIHKEGHWNALPKYVKNQFYPYMNYYNIYDAKNRDCTYGTYGFAGFNFCTNSLSSIFRMINEPVSFYNIDVILAKNFILSKIPTSVKISEKENRLKQIFETNNYFTIQEELYKMKNDGLISSDEVLDNLEKARIQCNK